MSINCIDEIWNKYNNLTKPMRYISLYNNAYYYTLQDYLPIYYISRLNVDGKIVIYAVDSKRCVPDDDEYVWRIEGSRSVQPISCLRGYDGPNIDYNLINELTRL